MRIVSLLPAATEWVAAFGVEHLLVGRSHACDYPPDLQDLPALTQPGLDVSGDASAIDRQVREQLQEGLSLYEVDLERLRALEPDLILTQTQCEVCAVSQSQLENELANWTRNGPDLVSIAPTTLKEVFDAALRIGRAVGRSEEAMQYLMAEELKLQRLHDRLGLSRPPADQPLPTVACIEWMEPLMIAGHWMPGLTEKAGGQPLLAEEGQPSATVSWKELRTADPDVLVLAPCGFSLEQTRENLHYLTDRPTWDELRAVREGRVFLFDGSHYFNRPGPRLYRSIRLLAEVLHPDKLPGAAQAEAWERAPLQSTHSLSSSQYE